MQILFYDLTTPVAYTDMTLQQQALRGTEATVVRVAHALSHYHRVFVAQHCRPTRENESRKGVDYISLESARELSPDVVILLRRHQALEQVVQLFPQAQHFFWMHNLPSVKLYGMRDIFIKHDIHIIAVSAFHRGMIERRLKGKWYQHILRKRNNNTNTIIPVHVIYNPVDDDLQPDDTQWNDRQLIFTSSPYKGLDLTLNAFKAVSAHFPDYEFVIASPDPLDSHILLPKQVRCIGSLPQPQLMQHIRESAFVFYPQSRRVETFGLVYAEANAVGTPVLAHHFGAASEVLSDPVQLVNGNDLHAVVEKVKQWRRERPVVQVRPAFRLSNVTQSWLKLLQPVMYRQKAAKQLLPSNAPRFSQAGATLYFSVAEVVADSKQ